MSSKASESMQIHSSVHLDRRISEMLGLCKMALLDGVVTPDEARFLNDWIGANPEVTATYVGNTLATRLTQIFEDGVVSPEEQRDLKKLLENLVGSQSGFVSGMNTATTLAFNDPLPQLTFSGQVYVFSGEFAFAPRSHCERLGVRCGAKVDPRVTLKTNVLVVGTLGSPAWAHSNFGRKIERALELRGRGHPIAIVPEEHWAAALPAEE